MNRSLPTEFVYQAFALLISIILVHAFYVSVVRPNAEAVLSEQARMQEMEPSSVPTRSVWVIIRDVEQEWCFILMLWALAIIGYKTVNTTRERRLLDEDLLHVSEGMRILPEDTRDLARQVESMPEPARSRLVPRVLLTALHRFASTRSIEAVMASVKSVCETEGDRLDSELSMIRYIAWAIPSIGFIGTVRGIGEALAQAHKAVEGDITGVTMSLGVAFNSTLVALLLSIVLMFIVHQLQLQQEKLVLDTETYADRNVVRHLRVQ
jgi:biopolymer transport protein ExbB/TolQ